MTRRKLIKCLYTDNEPTFDPNCNNDSTVGPWMHYIKKNRNFPKQEISNPFVEQIFVKEISKKHTPYPKEFVKEMIKLRNRRKLTQFDLAKKLILDNQK